MAADGDAGDLVVASPGVGSGFLQKFRLYETRSRFYMIGRDKSRMVWRVLKIDRLEPSELVIHEDPTVYSKSECYDLLMRIRDGNRSAGGLKFVTKCYGIVGFVKFLGPYYMLLITKRRKIGTICGHVVYAVSKSEIIALPNPSVRSNMAYSKDEKRYKRLLCTVDLTKDFFFSYSYNIMRSLQKNVCDWETGQVLYETMFVWNEFLTRGIRNILKNTTWTVALVYGFFKQELTQMDGIRLEVLTWYRLLLLTEFSRFEAKLSISGKDFRLTLIARRSRHFAGTRYLKRGVNEKGRVANDVETEQIVFEDSPGEIPTEITSVVQNRGSIPLFWSQETSRLNFRPDIILHKKDQHYEATRLHFDNLVKRYGKPIVILNLIKTREKRPRESLLRVEFAHAIHCINRDLSEENRLRFLHWDLHKHSRRKGANVLALLGKVAADALDLTGFFYCQVTPALRFQIARQMPFPGNVDDAVLSGYGSSEDTAENDDVTGNDALVVKPPKFQNGVLRTNCIDCLDRTNVAQYAYGLAALGHQLHALGFIDVPKIDLDAPLAEVLMGFYERMGDTLALQYGGSAAHNKIFSERRGRWMAATQSQELLRTIQRYYSNVYMDAEKQNAINVFLGHFQPQEGKPALWELNSDQHYNFGQQGHSFGGENARSFIKRSLSDGNILCQTDTSVSCSNAGQKEMNSALPPIGHPEEDAKGLSDSTPEISTCENDISYSRYTPVTSRRQFFGDSEHIYFNEHELDASNCSNFLDLDWLSSSGNSCEEEICESRSSIINSPVENLSTGNVLNGKTAEMTITLSEEGSSIMGREERDVESSDDAAQSSKSPDEYSDKFKHWVAYGVTLGY